MSSSTDIDLLRRFADGLDTSADRAALAERVRLYLTGAADGVSLDAAFGVARSAGALPWWRVAALAERDTALRALAASHYAGRPLARQANEIRSALLAYAASSWRFDRRETAPPARYLGTPHEIMFDVLKACDVVPSVRQIRRILRP